MEPIELRELLSIEGLRLLDSLPAFDAAADVVRTVAELRKAGHSPALVAAVLTQSKLRSRAAAKFGAFAGRMLFTEAGLEQATRLRVAAMHAGRFRDAGLSRIADLGCGIGADALAMAAIDLEVTGVERDEVTAALATYNLAPFPNAGVEHADAAAVDLAGYDGVYLDPARRDGARRLKDPGDWSPSLDFAFEIGSRRPTGVKLGPGVDRDLIPAGVEAQWISVDRDVVELGVWFGAVARPGIGRSALVIGDHGAAELAARRIPLRAGRCRHPGAAHRRPCARHRRPHAERPDRLPHGRRAGADAVRGVLPHHRDNAPRRARHQEAASHPRCRHA
jgi:hypothetical protein